MPLVVEVPAAVVREAGEEVRCPARVAPYVAGSPLAGALAVVPWSGCLSTSGPELASTPGALRRRSLERPNRSCQATKPLCHQSAEEASRAAPFCKVVGVSWVACHTWVPVSAEVPGLGPEGGSPLLGSSNGQWEERSPASRGPWGEDP